MQMARPSLETVSSAADLEWLKESITSKRIVVMPTNKHVMTIVDYLPAI